MVVCANFHSTFQERRPQDGPCIVFISSISTQAQHETPVTPVTSRRGFCPSPPPHRVRESEAQAPDIVFRLWGDGFKLVHTTLMVRLQAPPLESLQGRRASPVGIGMTSLSGSPSTAPEISAAEPSGVHARAEVAGRTRASLRPAVKEASALRGKSAFYRLSGDTGTQSAQTAEV